MSHAEPITTGEFDGYDFAAEEAAEAREAQTESARKRKPRRHTSLMTNLERFGDNGYHVDVVLLVDGIENTRQRMTFTMPAGKEFDLQLNQEVPYDPDSVETAWANLQNRTH